MYPSTSLPSRDDSEWNVRNWSSQRSIPLEPPAFATIESGACLCWLVARSLLLGLAVAVVSVCLLAQPPLADGRRQPIVLRVFAVNGAQCGQWSSVWQRIEAPIRNLRIDVRRCETHDPRRVNPADWKPGDLAIALDPRLPWSSANDTFEVGGRRVPVLIFNPVSVNVLSGIHEFTHYRFGHAAIGVDDPLLHTVVNTILDIVIAPAIAQALIGLLWTHPTRL